MADDTVLFPIRLSTFERADERTLLDASRPGIPDNFPRTTILFIKFTIDPPQLANDQLIELCVIVRTHSGSLQSSFSRQGTGEGPKNFPDSLPLQLALDIESSSASLPAGE